MKDLQSQAERAAQAAEVQAEAERAREAAIKEKVLARACAPHPHLSARR